MQTVRLIIKGKVQGVFYRATAKEVADKLGIKGWVKNLPDDNVEIKASGTEEQLQQFIAWCRQGPRRALVSEVVKEEMPSEDFPDFRILRW